MTPSRSFAAILSMTALLAACHRAPAPAPAVPHPAKSTLTVEQQREQDLMRAVFGAQYRPAKGVALASLTDPDEGAGRSSYYVTAQAHTVLASGDAVLVANAQPSSQDEDDPALKDIEEPDTSHAEPGLLNVFVLRPKSGGGWTVIRRHENVAKLGSSGQFGPVSWPMLAKDKPGLAVEHGWMGQGYMINVLTLFDLSDPQLPEVSPDQNKLFSNNQGACDEPSIPCWSVEGKWRFAPAAADARYDDLVIDFSGVAPPAEDADAQEEEASASEPAPARTPKKIAQSARYVFDGKRYRLTEGSNPVPDI